MLREAAHSHLAAGQGSDFFRRISGRSRAGGRPWSEAARDTRSRLAVPNLAEACPISSFPTLSPPCCDHQCAWSRKAAGALEPAESPLNLGPCLKLCMLVQPSQHLV
jgi:hypothetical protein